MRYGIRNKNFDLVTKNSSRVPARDPTRLSNCDGTALTGSYSTELAKFKMTHSKSDPEQIWG